jgi:hypothetical protein
MIGWPPQQASSAMTMRLAGQRRTPRALTPSLGGRRLQIPIGRGVLTTVDTDVQDTTGVDGPGGLLGARPRRPPRIRGNPPVYPRLVCWDDTLCPGEE